jgi:SAM-dependent methyltransferase
VHASSPDARWPAALPPAGTPAPAFPSFVCPRCRGPVWSEPDAYHCEVCPAAYPIVLGIPDFRVEPDPWIGLEDDREKARRLIATTPELDLAASVAAYWAMTPRTPASLARRFTEHVLGGEARAAEWLDAVERETPVPAGPWLEIGCASGDMLAAARRRGIPMVGVDVAMRWLVLARRRPALADGAQPLVCANGEFLPFAGEAFSRVVSVGTLEHCRRADAVLRETARVLRRGGDAAMRTTNRYSLLPEPHVDVWGVGFVPRRLADAYVRWRSGQRYLHHRPLSRRELLRGLRGAGFARARVMPARLLAGERGRLGRAAGAAVPLYDWARSAPGGESALGLVAPLLDLRGTVS